MLTIETRLNAIEADGFAVDRRERVELDRGMMDMGLELELLDELELDGICDDEDELLLPERDLLPSSSICSSEPPVVAHVTFILGTLPFAHLTGTCPGAP